MPGVGPTYEQRAATKITGACQLCSRGGRASVRGTRNGVDRRGIKGALMSFLRGIMGGDWRGGQYEVKADRGGGRDRAIR